MARSFITKQKSDANVMLANRLFSDNSSCRLIGAKIHQHLANLVSDNITVDLSSLLVTLS